jgi:anti-sigma regulatory factor (Ser/Thr protein kinase)
MVKTTRDIASQKAKSTKLAAYRLRTLQEVESLPEILANCFPMPEYIRLGLSEIILNALEHGNLGMGSEAKEKLPSASDWHREIERRQALPENQQKEVIVECWKTPDYSFFEIRDSGQGFNWRRYTNPEYDAKHASGKGIMVAQQLCFDALLYNEKGNQATCIICQHPDKNFPNL